MAIVLYEMLEIFFPREADFNIPVLPCRCHRQNLDKSLKPQYFRTIADVDGLSTWG